MIVDTSVIVAVAQQEPDWLDLVQQIATAKAAALPVTALVEATLVIEGRYGATGQVILDGVLDRLFQLGLAVVHFDATQADLAREAFRTYGKGRHPAALNFGDCLVYATAKALDAPLLFKGEDFGQTDIARA